MFKIGNVEIKNRVVLAPMAGITNEAYRLVCKKYNAGLVYAEMVSATGLEYSNNKTIEMLKVNEAEKPLSMQIFGYDIDMMVKAAKTVEKTNADIIDINMGCPVKKIVKSKSGSYLLTEPAHIYEMVKAIVDAVNKPVTVKIRSGFDSNNINAIEVAKLVEKAGASAIAIHARTRSQLYGGKADWNIIKQVKEAVNIPVIGNGDIKSANDALKMINETGCDAVMIGRGCLGNPFLINECYELLENNSNIIVPANYPEHFKNGYITINYNNEKVTIINLLGRVYMNLPLECPFRTARKIIDEVKSDYYIIDMHAEATSEKKALGYYLDGIKGAVLGTHTHVPTCDEAILENGTFYITDVGMTGPLDGVIGVEKEIIINRFLNAKQSRNIVATGRMQLNGVVLDFDNKKITRINIKDN